MRLGVYAPIALGAGGSTRPSAASRSLGVRMADMGRSPEVDL
jgi:hypothetical protein